MKVYDRTLVLRRVYSLAINVVAECVYGRYSVRGTIHCYIAVQFMLYGRYADHSTALVYLELGRHIKILTSVLKRKLKVGLLIPT